MILNSKRLIVDNSAVLFLRAILVMLVGFYTSVRSIVALSNHTGITKFGIGLEIILISVIDLTVFSRQERSKVFESFQQWAKKESK